MSHSSRKQASVFKPLRLEDLCVMQHRSSYSNANTMMLKRRETSIIKVSYLKAIYYLGQGGMIWENGIEICIISYMKQVTSPGSMHDTGCLGLVHWDNPEG